MSKVDKITTLVDEESPGLLDAISCEDGITKESLVRKVLALSHGQWCAHTKTRVMLPFAKRAASDMG